MKKVAIFCHDYSLSGANLSLLDYLKVYNRNDFDVKIFIPRNDRVGIATELDKLNIAHYCYKLFVVNKDLKKNAFKEKIKKIIKLLYNLLFGSSHFKKIEKLIANENFDVIISNSFAVLYGAKIASDLEITHVFHIREFMETDHQITHANQKEVKRLCEISSAIFISNSIKDYYLKKYNFADYKVIYNRIEYDNSFVKTRKFYQDKNLNILIAGTLQKNKGQIDAIKAVELIKDDIDVKLFICGQGAEESNLKKYCKDKGLNNIVFTGHLSKNELLELRKQIDISLVCSKMEALGRVTIESMYYESLTIGANSGETAYLLAQNRGFLYDFGNSNDLADKILKSLNSINVVNNFILNAKSFAINNFSSDVLGQILKEE